MSQELQLLVSGDGNVPLHIHQDARIFAGRLDADTQINHIITGKAYMLIAEGEVLVRDVAAKKGDGIMISDETSITLTAKTEAELLIIEVLGDY